MVEQPEERKLHDIGIDIRSYQEWQKSPTYRVIRLLLNERLSGLTSAIQIAPSKTMRIAGLNPGEAVVVEGVQVIQGRMQECSGLIALLEETILAELQAEALSKTNSEGDEHARP